MHYLTTQWFLISDASLSKATLPLPLSLPPPLIFPCAVCGERLLSDKSLKSHIKGHTTTIFCEVCSQPQSTTSKLKRHMLVHTKVKNYVCSMCPKAFYDNSKRRDHERIHTNERPYKCSICDYCARQHWTAKKHMMAVHGAVEVKIIKTFLPTSKEFSCKVCTLRFSTSADLKEHRTAEHPSVQQVYKCLLCSARFSSKLNFEKHQGSHF
jgi:KRAB domain-containing zinc finger protein